MANLRRSATNESEDTLDVFHPPTPEAVRNRPTPQSAPFSAVPEWVRGRAPLPPEGAPLQQTATWPSPPVDPLAGATETEVEDRNHPRNASERMKAHHQNGESLAENVKNSRCEQASWSISCSVLEMNRERAGRRRTQQVRAAHFASRQRSGGGSALLRGSTEGEIPMGGLGRGGA